MVKLFTSAQPGSLWKRYVLALSLLVAIVFAGHLFQKHALHQAKADAMLVNLSAKQRLLSLQIVLYADATATESLPGSQILMAAKIDDFERTHEFLTDTAAKNPELAAVYYGGAQPLDNLSRRFVADSRAFLQAPSDDAALRNLYRDGTGQMLGRLDRAVSAFEMAANKKASRIRQTEDMTLFVALLVIMLEAVLIFLPAHQAVKESHAKLREEVDNQNLANRRLKDFVDIASDLYWETDLAGRLTYVEGRLFDRLKGAREDLLGCHYKDVIMLSEEGSAAIQAASVSASTYESIDAEFIDTDGTVYVLRLGGKPRYSPSGELIGYLGRAHEVTSEVNLLGEVTRQALTDPLTGVANKRAFKQDLKEAVENASDAAPLTLLALDLDRFKPINDTYGHGAGDEVLKIVAARLQSSLRSGDWVARLGGDEFCVVCPGMTSDSAEQMVARRILKKVREPMALESGLVLTVGVSAGVATCPSDAATGEKLLAAADAALYSAKRSGCNQAALARDLDGASVLEMEQAVIRLAV